MIRLLSRLSYLIFLSMFNRKNIDLHFDLSVRFKLASLRIFMHQVHPEFRFVLFIKMNGGHMLLLFFHDFLEIFLIQLDRLLDQRAVVNQVL